jgi:hypothetical protein
MYHINKKKISTKQKNLNPWVFAITVATLIYVVLSLLFTSAKIEVPPPSSGHAPKIIMLPMNGKHYPAQKQLLYWLKDDNPTLIIQPNNKYGYSSILNPDYKFKLKDTPLDINSILTPPYFFNIPFNIHPIAIDRLTTAALFSSLGLINNPNIPKIPFTHKQRQKLNTPYVREYYSGTLLPVRFNNKDKIQKLVKKYNPKKPTVLLIDIPSSPLYFPVVDIISSCGSKELDKIAMDNLITANLSIDKSLRNRQIKVYAEFNKQ